MARRRRAGIPDASAMTAFTAAGRRVVAPAGHPDQHGAGLWRRRSEPSPASPPECPRRVPTGTAPPLAWRRTPPALRRPRAGNTKSAGAGDDGEAAAPRLIRQIAAEIRGIAASRKSVGSDAVSSTQTAGPPVPAGRERGGRVGRDEPHRSSIATAGAGSRPPQSAANTSRWSLRTAESCWSGSRQSSQAGRKPSHRLGRNAASKSQRSAAAAKSPRSAESHQRARRWRRPNPARRPTHRRHRRPADRAAGLAGSSPAAANRSACHSTGISAAGTPAVRRSAIERISPNEPRRLKTTSPAAHSMTVTGGPAADKAGSPAATGRIGLEGARPLGRPGAAAGERCSGAGAETSSMARDARAAPPM